MVQYQTRRHVSSLNARIRIALKAYMRTLASQTPKLRAKAWFTLHPPINFQKILWTSFKCSRAPAKTRAVSIYFIHSHIVSFSSWKKCSHPQFQYQKGPRQTILNRNIALCNVIRHVVRDSHTYMNRLTTILTIVLVWGKICVKATHHIVVMNHM